jgi:hypothetical protein
MALLGQALERHHNSIDNCFRTRCTARNVYIYGYHFVNAAEDVVAVMEHPARRGTGPNGNYHFGVGDLLIEILEHARRTPVHGSGDQQDIGMLWVAHIDNAEAFHVIERSQTSEHLDVTAIAGAVIEVHDPG